MDLGVAEVAEAEVVDLEVEVEAEVEAGDNEQKKKSSRNMQQRLEPYKEINLDYTH